MSLIGDVLTQLEVELRAIVPTLPAGTKGVERGWRPASQLEPGERPHVFLWNESEKPELLIFRQVRMNVSVTGLIVREGSTHAQALADYDALVAGIEFNGTLNGVLEQCEIALDGIEVEQGSKLIGTAFTLTGRKILA